MSFQIPEYLEPVFEVYHVPWPDINEDGFHALEQPLRAFGSGICAVGSAIEEALKVLAGNDQSRTLQALVTYFEGIDRDFLNPIDDLCGKLAYGPCNDAYDAVVDLKKGLCVIAGGLLANTVADGVIEISTAGVATAAVLAEDSAVMAALEESLALGTEALAGALTAGAENCINGWVQSIVQPFIGRVVNSVESGIDAYIPSVLLTSALTETAGSVGEDVAGAVLRFSETQFDAALTAIGQSGVSVAKSAVQLVDAIEEIFSEPAPQSVGNVSSALRILVRGVLVTVVDDLKSAVETLIKNLIDHVVSLLTEYQSALRALDAELRSVAAKQHAAAGPSVVLISAVGAGVVAAAGVATTSGFVNGEEAEQVQVECVEATPQVPALAVATTGPDVASESAAATDGVEDLVLPTGSPTVQVDEATATPNLVEEIHVRSEHRSHESPGEAESESGDVLRVSGKVRAKGAGPAAAGESPTTVEHLTVHPNERLEPHAEPSQAAREDVHRIEVVRREERHVPVAPLGDEEHATERLRLRSGEEESPRMSVRPLDPGK